MDIVYQTISEWFHAGMSSSWTWFNTLSREEWIVVLGVAAASGFLCLRGFGSRANR